MAGNREKQDICIVGAGPAGLAAGLRLSQLGIPFTLLEKEVFPRQKICGDGISGKSLMMLKRLDRKLLAGIGQSDHAVPSWGVRFYSPNRTSVRISFKIEEASVPSGYVMPRMDFDKILMDMLKETGTGQIVEGASVRRIARAPEGFELSAPDREIVLRSRLVLYAGGSDQGLIRSLSPGSPPLENEALGIRAYFKDIIGFEEDNLIEIHFLKELLPCYLWIFPLGKGRANVGLALPKERVTREKISLQKLLYELLEKHPHLKGRFVRAEPEGRPGAQRLPFFQGKLPLSGDNYMLLGDAARIVDPFTGEGIANALLSGMLAAETAASALKQGVLTGENLRSYDDKLYSELEKELSLGLRLQDLGKNAMLINLIVGRASRNKKIRELLKDILFGMNSMQELGKPLFYIKLMLGME